MVKGYQGLYGGYMVVRVIRVIWELYKGCMGVI